MPQLTTSQAWLYAIFIALLFSANTFSQGVLEVRTSSSSTSYVVIPNGDTTPSSAKKTDFEDVSVGATKRNSFSLTNTATVTGNNLFFGSPSVAISGTNASDFYLTSIPSTGGGVGANSNRTIYIHFNPASSGLKTATVTINLTTGTPTTYTFDIQGTGISTYGTIEVSTYSSNTGVVTLNGDTTPTETARTDFGTVTVGASTTNYNYLRNTSSNPGEYVIFGNPAMTISGPDASQFNIDIAPSNNSSLAGGSSSYFRIGFTPTSPGLKQATITFNLANGSPSPYTYSIQGVGGTTSGTLEVITTPATGGVLIPDGDVTPSVAEKTDYQNVSIGATKTNQFYLENIGPNQGDYIVYGSPSIFISGPDASQFSIFSTPAAGGSIKGLSYGAINVRFTPTSIGLKQATINISLSIGSPATYTFDIQGNGISTYGNIDVKTSPSTGIVIPDGDTTPTVTEKTDYEDVSIGASKYYPMYVENISTMQGAYVIFDNPSISITGADASQFRLSSAPSAGGSLADNAYDAYYIYFEPNSVGLKQATVNITLANGSPISYSYDIQGNAINTFGTLQVHGNTSIGPVIANGDITPSSTDFTDFEDVSIGGNKEFRYYFKNTTSNPGEYIIFNNPSATISGPNASEFALSNTTGGNISNTGSKLIILDFNPTSEGIKTATITVNLVNGSPSPYTFTVQGNGRTEDITVTGNGITIPYNNSIITTADYTDFGSQTVGGFIDRTFVITNTGGGGSPTNIVFDSVPIDFTGISASQYSVISGPAPSEILAIGASRSFVVRFNPTGGGVKIATININLSTGYPTPYNYNIEGYGQGVASGDNLIPNGALWNYYDSGAPPANWMDISFNDSGWNSGYGAFSTTSASTSPTLISSSAKTAYFRHTFNVTDASLANNLALLMGYTEGVVVYLNDVEVFRSFIPSGVVNHNTIANNSRSSPGYYDPSYIYFPNTLVNGTNTLSVEVHGDTSSRIFFNAELNYYNIISTTIPESSLFSKHWYNTFGSLMDFSTEPPSISNITVSGGDGVEGTSTWSNPFTGNLEVFLDLNTAYDENGTALTMVDNSPANMAMDASRTQMAFFLPVPGSNVEELYIIHGADADEQDEGDLNYSVLDVVTKKLVTINNPLINLGMTEGMTAINSGSDCGMWIVALTNTDETCTADCQAELRLWKVDKDNLLTPNEPPTQVIPLPFNIPGRGERATIRFSQQNDQIAIALEGRQTNDNITQPSVTSIDGGVRYASWDPTTATVGSWTKVPISVTEDTYTGYDVEFSPDGSRLFYGVLEGIRSRGPLHVHVIGSNTSTQLKYTNDGDEHVVNGSGVRLDVNNEYMYIAHKARTSVLYRLKNPNTVTSTADAQLERVATSDPETYYGNNLSQQSVFYPPCLLDVDGDLVIGESERDVDNDGISDVLEGQATNRDTDKDGVPDYLDLDSDNDGIPDLRESGLTNAQLSTFDPTADAVIDTAVSQNGFEDTLETGVDSNISNYTPVDTDGDGIPNYLDLDSDNDSILDVDESGNGDLALDGYDIDGDGFAEGNDTEGDGIQDRPDEDSSNFGSLNYPLPADDDSDGIPNYMEPDSDNDGTFDMESNINHIASWDADNDGILDDNTDDDDDGVSDTIDQDLINYGSPRYYSDKLHIEFDGINDYITTPIDLSGKNEVTISGWFKRSDLVSTAETGLFGQIGVISLYVKKTGSTHSISMRYGGNITSYGIGVGSSSIDLNNSYWHHAATSFNNGEIKLYIDGILVWDFIDINGNISLSIDNSKTFNIGGKASSKFSDALFKGSLDDIRVFDKALSEEQVKQMIYQEIQNVGGNVQGTIIPKDLINYSDDSKIPWAKVLGYYNIKDVRGDVLFDEGTGLNPGKLHNIKTYDYQTAPMPYETKTGGDGMWTNANNWLHGDVWDITQLPTNDAAIIQIHDNLETAASHTHLGLFVDDTKTLKVTGDNELNNSFYLQLDGTLNLEGDSQLIQSINSDLVTDANGKLLRRQEGNSNVYWYNYWTSPVGTLDETTLTPAGDNDSSNNTKNTAFYLDMLTNGLGADIPFTNANDLAGSISDQWLYTFQNGITYWDWVAVDPTMTTGTPIAPGVGYTQKGTGNGGTEQQYTFEGKPNNGTIWVAANDVVGDSSNESEQDVTLTTTLVGNPYPSALDAHKFIMDNIGVINSTAPTIQGTILLWEQWAGSSHLLAEYEGGYGYINLTETARAYQHPDISIATPTLPFGIKTPTEFIPVGQGFFVEVIADSGNIEFNNSQRVFKDENAGESVFFRNAPSQDNTAEEETVEDPMQTIKLEFGVSNGATRRFVLGFSDTTTDDFDYGYDGGLITQTPEEDMTTLLQDKQYVIQAYAPITPEKVIDLAFNASGNYTYSLDIAELKNIAEDQDIYLRDNLIGTYFDLRDGQPYAFTSEAGFFNDRFDIVFKNDATLDVDSFDTSTVLIYNNRHEQKLFVKGLDQDAKSLIVTNMLGQTIKHFSELSVNELESGLFIGNLSSGVYMVNLVTDDNIKIDKKIILE